MDRRITIIVRLLRVGAAVSLLVSAWFGLVMATFATDAPSSSYTLALMIGAGVFVVLALPTAAFPLWAARRARRLGGAGLLPAIIFALLALTVFPFGTIVGVWILLEVRAIRRDRSAPPQ